ncbi:hypothetical protein HOS78_gp027 [Lactobacillus phage Bacchae]|uniref:CBM-cenC domain-containing protein n=1 Tax=Lactobacillus phage Bacchae TaxID=2079429 RepID=A0A2K9VCK7_9CAUD|nr:hypothetical protein HOS78_gp027 [Lactobacillus phage Bacchae]AUV59963.1 hypothetical protein [Lactobacillus phage Bacchae]
MSLLSFLHPLWKRSLNEYDDSVNSAVIGALNQSLSKSEEDMVQSKVESYLSTADAKWLDYWGYWFGERRKSGWSDDYYRSRIVNHVEHARGTVDALRDAIADFINTNKDNIYIYEPYRDMFIWNSSKYNTKKYFSSTYYRYAVIDIQISASYPKEIVSIINLFRPAGVLWVLTETVNSRNSDAPIIDIKNPKDVFVPKIENDFIFGLRKRTRLVINPSKDEYETVTNPFTYNKKDSLFNNRNSLFMGATQTSKRYSFVGQPLFDYTPDANDTLEYSSYNVEQLSNSDIASVSTKNGRGKTFGFNPAKDNLISNASDYINGVKLNSNTGNPNLLTGTSGTLQTVTNASGWNDNLPVITKVLTTIDSDTTYTARAWISPASHDVNIQIAWQDARGTRQSGGGNVISAGTSGYSTWTGTITAGSTIKYVTIAFREYQSTPSSVSYKGMKFEKGSVATPYSPAPSEQTTSQSGSLVIPIVNVNPDCAYSFSAVSMSDKDSPNASLSLTLKDKSGNDITSNITTSISSGKHILRINPKTSASFSSNGYAVISFSGISNTDNISISLMCLKLSKSLDVPNRNLFLNSKSIKDVYGINENAKITLEPFDSTTNMWHIVAEKGSGSPAGIYIFNYADGKLPDNSDWSYSFDVKGTGKFYKSGIESGVRNPVVGNISSEWSRISQSGLVGNGSKTIIMYFDTNISALDVYIKLPKLETGTTPTPWSPAPEDSIGESTANTNPMSWAQSADEETNTPTKLADTIDLRGFINDNYKTLSTTVTNKELNDLFGTKKLHLVIKTVNSPSGSLTIRFFNFNTNLWVTYGNFEVIGSYTDIFVKLDDITPLMNKNSLIYVSMEFSNDKSISVSLDYIGLSLSNSEDGYSIKMFADQSSYGIETEVAMGPFIISKSSVSRAYISPSRYKIGDPEYGKIGHYPLA